MDPNIFHLKLQIFKITLETFWSHFGKELFSFLSFFFIILEDEKSIFHTMSRWRLYAWLISLQSGRFAQGYTRSGLHSCMKRFFFFFSFAYMESWAAVKKALGAIH